VAGCVCGRKLRQIKKKKKKNARTYHKNSKILSTSSVSFYLTIVSICLYQSKGVEGGGRVVANSRKETSKKNEFITQSCN
jgi:hypothetical protein